MMSAVCASVVEDEPQEGNRRLPIFRFNQVLRAARGAKASPGTQQRPDEAESPRKNARRRASEQKRQIRARKQELRRLRQGLRSASEKAERTEYKQSKKRVQQEIFRLRKELGGSKQQARGNLRDRPAPQIAVGAETGALPDLVIIGGKKCRTSSLYDLLTQHPHVEPAASKELHYFDLLFEEESPEWYRRCFPTPRWEDGRMTITGEATPYMPSRKAPEMMAEVVPGVRLISLLRNPVDRAYSDYQQVVRKGREPRTFEEALGDETSEYLTRSVYVDQLLRWSEFFDREQMLVLKSEDFFERPTETLSRVLAFLDLPGWQPEEAEVRNRGTYTENMDPATRRRLEEYFEPHNWRLYEHLGTDLGW